MSAHQRVLVTFASSLSFLESDQWRQVHASLLAQLPLRNLHWRSPNRPLRTIQELPVELVALDTVRYESTSQLPLTVLERPLVNIYVTTCEDSETYRISVKKQIKEWHTTVTQRKNQEWLILHLVRPDARASNQGFFQMKSTVMDKIKADFNVDKRDRCVQLAWASGQDNPTAWAEMISKIKDGVLTAWDSAITQREDEVKKSQSQKQMPGWNFCTFFILKESLAASFEGVDMYDDAMDQYEELEALFFDVLKDRSLAWFGSFITPAPKDDSMPLLSIEKKPYRDLIIANTISVFDFRVYLLARQCIVLGKMGRVVDVTRKASAFLSAFGKRLRELGDAIPDLFVESWTYSSALSVVAETEQWASSLELDASSTTVFSATRGELIELARSQLDTLGVKLGHLPAKPPFLMSSVEEPPHALANGDLERSAGQISNTELLLSFESPQEFYDLYSKTTKKAIELFAKAGRRKSALRLHGSLAALDVHRGQLESALTTYTSLPAHYGPNRWTSLECYMLSQALDTHYRLEKPKDREWLTTLLSFLKAYVQDLGEALLMHEEDKTTYVSGLVSELKTSADALESEMEHPDHPMISLEVQSTEARLAETEDSCVLDITVQNHLSTALPVEEIIVTLTGRGSERLEFTAMPDSIPPGSSVLTVSCPTSSWGTYLLESSEIRISRLRLQWNYRKTLAKKGRTIKETYHVVRIPRDLNALDVRLDQPRRIELGAPSKMHLVINTNRNDIRRATFRLSPAAGVRVSHQDARVDHSGSSELVTTEDEIIVTDLPASSCLSLSVPHSDTSMAHALKIDVSVEYVTEVQPDVIRSLRITQVVNTALPIAVNVQDFFRGSRLFSKFTVSTTSQQHVRLRSAELEESQDSDKLLQIRTCTATKTAVKTVTPVRPGNFVFQIDAKDGPIRRPLQLRIVYRTMREEVEALVRGCAQDLVLSSPALGHLRAALVDRLISGLEGDSRWVDLYSVIGELQLPPIAAGGDEVLNEAVDQAKTLLRETSLKSDYNEEWRELVIPVDVPRMNIIAAARMQLLANPFSTTPSSKSLRSLYAGQPISATLSVHTSFRWGSETPNERGYMLRFDVEEMVRDWLVSGPKRGDFLAKDGETFTAPLTLIALHHGELALPKVHIEPLPLSGSMEMGGSMAFPSLDTHQVHGAEKVLVLPRGGRSTFVISMGHDTLQ